MTETNRKLLVDKLRQQAREHLQRLNQDDPLVAAELTRIIEEHEVYQTELEMQNEELRQITQNLEESRDQYLRLYNAIPSGFLSLDVRGKIQRVNRSTVTMLGRPVDKLVGLPFSLLVHPDDLSGYIGFIRTGRQPDKKYIQTEIRVSADGRDFIPVLLELRSGAEKGEETDHWLISLTDISRTKAAERQLQQAHDRLETQVEERTHELSSRNEILETIVDNIPVMIVFYDSDWNVSYVNPTTERLLGMNVKQMRQIDTMTRLYPDPDYRQEMLDFMRRAGGEWKDVTMFLRGKKFLESSWANVRLSDGTYIGIGIDISERKQAEKKIDQYIAELKWKNRELQEFASVASHDLQEPLRKIQTFGKLLKEDLPEEMSDKCRDYLARMIGAAERMQQLIKALLDYSRMSTKKKPFKRVDLKKISESVIKDMVIPPGKKEPFFDIGDMDRIEADEIQMRQLIQNLIANSLNYSKSDASPRVSITASRIRPLKNSRKTFCELRVSDNGIGFDTCHLEKIFMPFERLHARHQYSGTGMGLPICRKIAERHGGWITAESTPGVGSTFIVTLPLTQKREK